MTRLTPGDQAPAWTLTDDAGRTRSLQDFGGSRLILFFYPAAGTPGCTKEACDFRDSLTRLQDAGYQVVGISPDPVTELAAFRDAEGLTYPLLSDPDKEVLSAYGAYGEKKLYGRTVTGVIRSTIVLGPDGTVDLARYNVRASGHVASLAKALNLAA